jgi:multidrug efflux pump subunit AcrA (membrane-fusion protein)
MAGYFMLVKSEQINTEKSWGSRYRWLKIILAVVVLVVLVGGVGYFIRTQGEVGGLNGGEEEIPLVAVSSLGELVESVTIKKIATVEPAVGAPLVARAGGRVTSVRVNLGESVRAGQVILGVDGGVEASPARAQLAAFQSSLVVLNDIKREALRAADNAIRTAQLSVETARSGRILTTAQVTKSREQADLAVRQAELAFEDAVEAEQRVDQVVRAADIGLQAALISKEQAEIAGALANQQTGDALKQAEQGLNTARQARERIVVDIQSQRVSLEGQVATAAEQVKLSQVISPVSGQVTRLTVKRGDFVSPGQEVGEIMAFEGARINVDVTAGVREKLSIGQEVFISAQGQEFTGEIVRLADGPRTDIALWQVDIFISGTPEVVHPGDLVKVALPVGTVGEGALFIPLDAVVVRQDGVVLMTVNEEGVVSEHLVKPISYSGDYIEAVVDVPGSAMVVVNGNRTLRAGDMVRFES